MKWRGRGKSEGRERDSSDIQVRDIVHHLCSDWMEQGNSLGMTDVVLAESKVGQLHKVVAHAGVEKLLLQVLVFAEEQLLCWIIVLTNDAPKNYLHQRDTNESQQEVVLAFTCPTRCQDQDKQQYAGWKYK
eukprot:6209960-Pleurochrysis_carterae.AAC.2